MSETTFCYVAEKDGRWHGVTAGDYEVTRFYADFAGYTIKPIATRVGTPNASLRRGGPGFHRGSSMSEHPEIWLEPEPPADREWGRQWCQHNVWGERAAHYVLASAPAPTVSGENEPIDSQVDRLAKFIMAEVPGEPSQSEGAIDCAIRWMRARLHPAPTRAEVLEEAIRKLLGCPAIADVDHSDPAWGDLETAAAESFARRALAGEKP